MTDIVKHALVAYERETGRAVGRRVLDGPEFEQVKLIVPFDSDDPWGADAYDLTRVQAREVARALGVQFDFDRYDYAIEPFAESARRIA